MTDQEILVSERSFKEHAARLNRIGINIRNVCDVKSFSTVFIRETREINPINTVEPPKFYKKPSHLRAVA